MRLLLILLILAAFAFTGSTALGVSWRATSVALLVATAVLLGPEPKR